MQGGDYQSIKRVTKMFKSRQNGKKLTVLTHTYHVKTVFFKIIRLLVYVNVTRMKDNVFIEK